MVCPKKGKCTAGYERLEEVDIYRYPLIYEANKGVPGYFVEFVYCWLASLVASAEGICSPSISSDPRLQSARYFFRPRDAVSAAGSEVRF